VRAIDDAALFSRRCTKFQSAVGTTYSYSPDSNSGSVVLCFGGLRFAGVSARDGGGVPILSRARAFTAVVARNGLTFFFFAISAPALLNVDALPGQAVQSAAAPHRVQ
jgi:hypothetical protein